MARYSFNKLQAEQAGKYFLDLSKIIFSVLVLGLLASSQFLALRLMLWYIGVVATVLTFALAMYLLRTRR